MERIIPLLDGYTFRIELPDHHPVRREPAEAMNALLELIGVEEVQDNLTHFIVTVDASRSERIWAERLQQKLDEVTDE